MNELEIVKDFMVNSFYRRISDIFRSANPKKFEYWGGNSCRQTAILGAFFLEKLLPQYKWTTCIASIDRKFMGRSHQADHAWCFGYNNILGGIVVDVESVYGPLIEKTDLNKLQPPTKIIGKIRRLDRHFIMRENEREYYTAIPYPDFLAMLELELMSPFTHAKERINNLC